MKGSNGVKNKKAVVLLSGGLDSITAAYIARKRGYDVSCLIFDYGQRHKKEVLSARRLAELSGFKYKIIRFRLPWGGSSLLNNKIKIPRNRALNKIHEEIPSTYVPARNTLFIAFAVSHAEAIDADSIYIGANAVDFSGYPDCRPNYFKAYRKLIKEGTRYGKIKIEAPLLKMTKAEIIKKGISLGVPHELTWSCYAGGKIPCGTCDSCLLREKGFREAGLKDPLS